jgi:hypothetical protein
MLDKFARRREDPLNDVSKFCFDLIFLINPATQLFQKALKKIIDTKATLGIKTE